MKFLVAFLLLYSISVSAQNADFIQLRKKGKVQATYFAGSDIAFSTSTGAYINAHISAIRKDTLYLQEFLVQRMITKFGFYIIDTVGSFRYQFHYRQIAMIGRNERKNFSITGSGASLFGGGMLLTLGNAVVFLADHKKFSPGFMAASAGLCGLGYLLLKSGGSKGLVIGKKYKLQYMDMRLGQDNTGLRL